MTRRTRQAFSDSTITFSWDDDVDILYWFNPETKKKQWRLEGIYSDINTEEKVFEHLAWNVLANGVQDMSRLDGWADLELGKFTAFVDEVHCD